MKTEINCECINKLSISEKKTHKIKNLACQTPRNFFHLWYFEKNCIKKITSGNFDNAQKIEFKTSRKWAKHKKARFSKIRKFSIFRQIPIKCSFFIQSFVIKKRIGKSQYNAWSHRPTKSVPIYYLICRMYKI